MVEAYKTKMVEAEQRDHYIWKAKHQRGLTDEQVQYFLDRDTRYDLMPYYSLCCKRLGCEQGYAEVVKLYGAPKHKILDVTGAELKPGKPDECQGNGKHEGYECCCDECDFLETCLESEEIDLRGSHERRSAPQDRGEVRQTKLEDFLKK